MLLLDLKHYFLGLGSLLRYGLRHASSDIINYLKYAVKSWHENNWHRSQKTGVNGHLYQFELALSRIPISPFHTHLHLISNGIVSPGDDHASLSEINPASLKGELVFLTLCWLTLNKM